MKKLLIFTVIILSATFLFLAVPMSSAQTPTLTPCVAFELLSDHTWRQSFDCNIMPPTHEVFTETPTPQPTETPDTTCYITPKDSNINIRVSPQVGTTVVGLMQVGMETVPVGFSNGWYKVWWPGDTKYPKSTWGWTLGSLYNTRGDCSKLPLS